MAHTTRAKTVARITGILAFLTLTFVLAALGGVYTKLAWLAFLYGWNIP